MFVHKGGDNAFHGRKRVKTGLCEKQRTAHMLHEKNIEHCYLVATECAGTARFMFDNPFCRLCKLFWLVCLRCSKLLDTHTQMHSSELLFTNDFPGQVVAGRLCCERNVYKNQL